MSKLTCSKGLRESSSSSSDLVPTEVGDLLARQLLSRDHQLDADGVVEAIGGINAQTPRAAGVALWARQPRVDLGEIDTRLRG